MNNWTFSDLYFNTINNFKPGRFKVFYLLRNLKSAPSDDGKGMWHQLQIWIRPC